MAGRTVKRTVQVRLSEAEIADRGHRLAEVMEERDKARQEAKAANDEAKDAIKSLEGHADGLARVIRLGYEPREVECRIVFVRDDGLVKYVRLDTGEAVESRQMTEEERQLHLLEGLSWDDEDEPEAKEG